MRTATVAGMVLSAGVGLASGLIGYTFVYAKGYSYLTNDPAACANCHVMREQYDGWLKASHRKAAACNDCHTPPDVVGKVATKATNGFWHSYYFTLGGFHEPLRIGPRNREVTEKACRGCHQEIVAAIEGHGSAQTSCIRCHSSVGHMETTAIGMSRDSFQERP